MLLYTRPETCEKIDKTWKKKLIISKINSLINLIVSWTYLNRWLVFWGQQAEEEPLFEEIKGRATPQITHSATSNKLNSKELFQLL